LEILQKFIDHKVDIDCTDGQNRTPLMWAASTGAVEALRILYKYGANQLHGDKDSLTGMTFQMIEIKDNFSFVVL